MDNYNLKRIKNGVSVNGAKLKITEVSRKDGELITRKKMIKLCNQFLESVKEKYPDAEGLVSVTIKYPNRWYSSDVSKFSENIHFFTMEDYEMEDEDPNEYESFRFLYIPIKRITEGGDDEHNDCLINAINQFFECISKYLDPKKLKDHLGLERDDKIDVSRMREVEQFINTDGFKERQPYALFVSGDAFYESTIKSNKRIYITLSKGHYSVNKDKIKNKSRRCFEEKPIVMAEYSENGYECFDGENTFVMSNEDFQDVRYKYLSTPYLFVLKGFVRETKNMELSDAYHYYIEMADEMKLASKGLFNFYKTPTVKNMALNYFYDLTKAIQPDDISNNEAKWINKASTHAITYHEYYEGDIHIYDINSRYPHVMQKNNNQFPIREGEWKTVNKIDSSLYGIYRCVISKPDNKPYKFFTFNQSSYYTHLDVKVAEEYGLTIELISDDKPNFLHYSSECLISGQYLFKKYVDKLYHLKQDKVKGSKALLNILWGALTEKMVYKPRVKLDEETDLSGVEIHRLHCEDDHLKLHVSKPTEQLFLTNYGRIKPFVLAYARSQMFFSFRKWETIVMRIHTDSLYLTKIPKDMLPCSNKLGQLKHEYSGKIKIISLNKVMKI